MKRTRKNELVCQYLEKISRKALEGYQDVIRSYVKGRHGIYALYRKDKLYYVGLASNLRSRLRHHLRDRHAGTWDHFSVYLTIGSDRLREIEALLLRITMPKGNRQKGKLHVAEDLKKRFKKDIKKAQSLALEELCGSKSSRKKTEVRKQLKKMGLKKKGGRTPTLAPFVKKRFHIKFKYKGEVFIAHVRMNGTIRFAANSAGPASLRKHVFTSPSLAARAVKKRATNGWSTWHYERAPGDWVKLDELRK